jgi:hypothetical protein
VIHSIYTTLHFTAGAREAIKDPDKYLAVYDLTDQEKGNRTLLDALIVVDNVTVSASNDKQIKKDFARECKTMILDNPEIKGAEVLGKVVQVRIEKSSAKILELETEIDSIRKKMNFPTVDSVEHKQLKSELKQKTQSSFEHQYAVPIYRSVLSQITVK